MLCLVNIIFLGVFVNLSCQETIGQIAIIDKTSGKTLQNFNIFPEDIKILPALESCLVFPEKQITISSDIIDPDTYKKILAVKPTLLYLNGMKSSLSVKYNSSMIWGWNGLQHRLTEEAPEDWKHAMVYLEKIAIASCFLENPDLIKISTRLLGHCVSYLSFSEQKSLFLPLFKNIDKHILSKKILKKVMKQGSFGDFTNRVFLKKTLNGSGTLSYNNSYIATQNQSDLIIQHIPSGNGYIDQLNNPRPLSWHPQKNILAFSKFNRLIIINVEQNKTERVLKDIHTKDIVSVCWNTKGNLLASSGRDRQVNIYNITTGLVMTIPQFKDSVRALQFIKDPKGIELLALGHTDRIECYSSHGVLAYIQKLARKSDYTLIKSLAINNQGDIACIVKEDYHDLLYYGNLYKKELLSCVEKPASRILSLGWSPNNTQLFLWENIKDTHFLTITEKNNDHIQRIRFFEQPLSVKWQNDNNVLVTYPHQIMQYDLKKSDNIYQSIENSTQAIIISKILLNKFKGQAWNKELSNFLNTTQKEIFKDNNAKS